MSDPTFEEDSLISQDDIDKLLDSSSIEEAEEKLSSSDTDAAIDIDTDDELGELSQDDIDSLMNSNTSNPEDLKDEDDDIELISQDDIDQLMNSNVSSDEDASAPSDDENDSSDDDFGELSQEDINNLMSGRTADPPVESETFDNKEQDSLSVEEKNIDQPDDQPDETAIVEETVQPDVEDDRQEDDYIIDESEAADVQDSLIAQDTIDDLIKNFNNEDSPEPIILDEEPVPDPEVQPESAPETVAEPDEPNGQEDTVLDDTEDFLKPDSDVTVLDFDDQENEDVTQEDIDSLLLESDDDDEDDEDDILISQDDIDTLLMAADQEDEDVLGDLMDDEFDDSMDDESDDEDILESDGFDEDDEDDDKDQVVLEGDDEQQVVKQKKNKTKAKSQWYKSKLVIAGVYVLVILGITVPLAYFIFFQGGPGKEVQPDPVANLAVVTPREIEIETVDIHVKKQGDIKKPGNMILKDFVILASDQSKDMAYITADISIDYSDQKAYQEIQNNLSFYRDLIYDSINKSLVSEKREEITEADILWIVETTLKKVLPGHYINRVSFKSFKAS